MAAAHILDVSTLRDYEVSEKAPLFWGQVLLCAIEGSMFGMLIAMYFYIRLSVDAWPPPGVEPPNAILGSVAWAPLIISVIGSYWASQAAKKDNRGGMIFGLSVNLLFALVFLVVRFYDWVNFNFNWTHGAYGSIVWAILFLHTFDVSADLFMTAVLIAVLAIGRTGPKQRLGVHVDSVVWYFLVAIWAPLYAVVFGGPWMVGT